MLGSTVGGADKNDPLTSEFEAQPHGALPPAPASDVEFRFARRGRASQKRVTAVAGLSETRPVTTTACGARLA